MRTLFAALGLLAGCDYVLRIDHIDPSRDGSVTGDVDDASTVDAPPSYTCMFSAALPVPEIVADYEDPAQSGNKRELYLSFFDMTTATSDIFVARRSMAFDLWGTPLAAAGVNSPADDTDPVLARSDTMVVFTSTRAQAGRRVFQATRSSIDQSFGTPMIVFDSFASGIDISPDGLTLYVCDGNGTLGQIRRTDPSAQFTAAAATVVGTGVYFPSVAGDGLTVYYHRNTSLYRQTRMSTSDAFTNEQPVAAGTDADISDDGRELLYFTEVSLARAICP